MSTDFPLATIPALGTVAGALSDSDSRLRGAAKGLATGTAATLGSIAGQHFGNHGLLGAGIGAGLGYLGSNYLFPGKPSVNKGQVVENTKDKIIDAILRTPRNPTLLPNSYFNSESGPDYIARRKLLEGLDRWAIKTSESAYGIPDRSVYGDHTKLPVNELVDFIIQSHNAAVAGQHKDWRLGTPETGLFSWATKKEAPIPGKRIALFQQPTHQHSYGSFEGTIPEGYGKGTVKLDDKGKALITKITPEALHFTVAHKKNPERFALIKPKNPTDKRWLLVNTTPTEPLPFGKEHFTTVEPEKVEKILSTLQTGSSVQTKIDGGAQLLHILKDKIESTSYRKSKETDRPIVYTEKLFGGKRPEIKPPKEIIDSVLKGELYGTDQTGKVLPVQQLGGLLNKTIANSLEAQKAQNLKLQSFLFDIDRYGKTPIDKTKIPYSDRLNMVKEILSKIQIPNASAPSKEPIEAPTEATTADEASKLWKQVSSGNHPLTTEGVVIHPKVGRPVKAKIMHDHDVYVHSFAPGLGKYKDRGIGAINYSLEPGGESIGQVGTGFDDATRADMYTNPQNYIGQIAKVTAQGAYPSGALRVPAFQSMHLDPVKQADQNIQEPTLNTITPDLPVAKPIPIPQLKARTKHPLLASLMKAKMYSDLKNYDIKNAYLSELMNKYPDQFVISETQPGGIVGIMHKGTGFKIHTTLTTVPDIIRQRGTQTNEQAQQPAI